MYLLEEIVEIIITFPQIVYTSLIIFCDIYLNTFLANTFIFLYILNILPFAKPQLVFVVKKV